MNYYVALRFREEPELHMTLQYYSRAMCQRSLTALVAQVGEKVGRLSLHEAVTMGFKSKVRALAPSEPLPEWVYEFTKHGWIAHVTTLRGRLDLVVDAIAIMHKGEEVARWELR